jgi:TPR repeat protein
MVRAAALYRAAAEQGYAAAQLNLGGMYYAGLGVSIEYVCGSTRYI